LAIDLVIDVGVVGDGFGYWHGHGWRWDVKCWCWLREVIQWLGNKMVYFWFDCWVQVHPLNSVCVEKLLRE